MKHLKEKIEELKQARKTIDDMIEYLEDKLTKRELY